MSGALVSAGWLGGVLLVVAIAQVVHLAIVLPWIDQRTRGHRYYGLPLRDRRRFRRLVRLHAALLAPIVTVLSRLSRFRFENGTFSVEGVAGPKGMCSEEGFRRASAYQPRPEDVFVATQMKCGTTWMQHLVYQVLTRGDGPLLDEGTSLFAVSPWLESDRTVSVEQAPLIGRERPSRIIKTHLPAHRCPDSAEARFIYVARHPVSCFASCVDFVSSCTGAFSPPIDEYLRWFLSEELMWWTVWPSHVSGWSRRARENPNVLFVKFEDMTQDLGAVADRVARFLDLEALSSSEREAIVRRCGFATMKAHADCFEMHPPHVLQGPRAFFVSGRADRHRDVPEHVKERIVEWHRQMSGRYPIPPEHSYPDLLEEAGSGVA